MFRRKQSLDAKRLNAFSMDPDKLVIIGVDTDDGPEHPLWDTRAFLPIEESLVLNIMCYGIIEPVTAVKDGDRAVVVDGRRRVLHAREAKKRQEKAGEVSVMVPLMVKRGSDGRLFGISRSANEHRASDDLLTRAENAQRMIDLGESEETVAVTFGIKPQTVRIWLSLLDLDNTVKIAVKNGELSASAAAKLAKLPRAEQKTTLVELREQGKVTTKKTAARVRAKRTNGESITAPGKKVLKKLIAGEFELEDDFIAGMRFAIGDLNPAQVKGLKAALRELGVV